MAVEHINEVVLVVVFCVWCWILKILRGVFLESRLQITD